MAVSDYSAELTGDPVYQRALGDYNLNVGGGRRSLRDQINQMVLSSGFDPTGNMTGELAGYAADVDNGTRLSASSNQFSTRARLEQALNVGKRSLKYQLAARGLGSSGAAAAGGSILQQGYDRGSYGAMQDLLSKLGGGVETWKGLETSELAKLRGSASSVADRLAKTPGASYETPAAVKPAIDPAFRPKASAQAAAALTKRWTAFGKLSPRTKQAIGYGGGLR